MTHESDSHQPNQTSPEAVLARLLSHALLGVLREAAKDGTLAQVLGLLPQTSPAPTALLSSPESGEAQIPRGSTALAAPADPLPLSEAVAQSEAAGVASAIPGFEPTPTTVSDLKRDFDIVNPLGGDMNGEIMLGRQRNGGRTVMIRLYSRVLPLPVGGLDRMRMAAGILIHHDHPNVVKVLSAGNHLGHPFVVHESVHGRALGDIIATRCPMPEHDVLRLAEQVAKGLQSVHLAAGIVHGDLRPGTILIEFSGIAGGLEAGDSEIAKITEFIGPRVPWHIPDQVGPLAVPSYIAPEQLERPAEDPRTDIYALGAIMFHLLSGEPPIGGKKEEALASLRAWRAPDLKRLPKEVSEQTRNILITALAAHPKDRYLAHQGFIVACQRAMNPGSRGELRSMRFLRKPLVLQAQAPRPVHKSDFLTPLPDSIVETPRALPSARERGSDLELLAIATEVEGLDLGTRILRKHQVLSAAGAMAKPGERSSPRSAAEASSRVHRGGMGPKADDKQVVSQALERRKVAPQGESTMAGLARQVSMKEMMFILPFVVIGAVLLSVLCVQYGWFRI